MAVMANQACMVFDFFFFSSPGILRQPLHLARERETFWYLFRLCTPYGSRVSLGWSTNPQEGTGLISIPHLTCEADNIMLTHEADF